MKSLKERIAIELEYSDGVNVQYFRMKSDTEWSDLRDDREKIIFDWANFDYRIKAEPMEFYVNIYDDGQLAVHRAKKIATDQYLRPDRERKTIKVREVKDES